MVIGHVTYDLVSQGCRPGGTAVYASLTAQRLGERVAVVTSAGPDYDFAGTLPGIAVANRPAAATTTFHNVATAHGRRQRLLARAVDLGAADVPEAWRAARIVHLAPLVGEVPPGLLALFPEALTGVTAQGWLRRWDAKGWISRRGWPEAEGVLGQAGAAILSAGDLGDDAPTIARYATWARLLVVTRGAQGTRVYYGGEVHDVPAFPAKMVDPTGAGDVFAAAFLIALARRSDPYAAARFANSAASLAVEQPGIAGVPTPEAVQERLARG